MIFFLLLHVVYITEQYSLRPSMLFASESVRVESCDAPDLPGLVGLEAEEVLDEGLAGVLEDDFELDRLAEDLLLDLAALLPLVVVLFLEELLAGLTGVLKSAESPAPVKLSSLIGDTDDLLLAVDFLVDFDLEADEGRFALLADEEDEEVVLFFLIEAGVVLAFDEAFGLGVLLMGFEARLAGVALCLAIVVSSIVVYV